MGGRDEVVLTEWERDRLAEIEWQFAERDPRFTRRFARRWSGPRREFHLAAAITLILAGWIVTVVMFTRSLWLAIIGLTMMGAGSWQAITRLAGRKPGTKARVAGLFRRRSHR